MTSTVPRAPRAASSGPRKTLHELAVEHGTDKAPSGVAAIYEPFVASRREQNVSLLEIGVEQGGSLRMWRDYFPNGRIVGIDSQEAAAQHASERIQIIVGDQVDTAVLDKAIAMIGPFDIVVDDGGHWSHQQIASLLYLWPHVKPGGFYVVEDTHTSYMRQYDMGYRNPASAIEFLKGLIDDLHSRWHTHPLALEHLRGAHFYNLACLLEKEEPLALRTQWEGIGRADWDL